MLLVLSILIGMDVIKRIGESVRNAKYNAYCLAIRRIIYLGAVWNSNISESYTTEGYTGSRICKDVMDRNCIPLSTMTGGYCILCAEWQVAPDYSVTLIIYNIKYAVCDICCEMVFLTTEIDNYAVNEHDCLMTDVKHIEFEKLLLLGEIVSKALLPYDIINYTMIIIINLHTNV